MNVDPTVLGLREKFSGVLIGTAVGDALGLPAENLSPERIRKRWRGEWRMRLVFGRGMISDDTEHTLMIAQSLLSSPDDVQAFQRSLSWKLRWWFVGLPGGVGLATAKACLRMWLGFPLNRCGVKSGGSGPAMRSAIIGAYFADQPEQRRAFVAASSQLTHRGWQAELGAMAVAESVALAVRNQAAPEMDSVLELLHGLSNEGEWRGLLAKMRSAFNSSMSVSDFARSLSLQKGVTGYALHVVPVALYAWLRHPADFSASLAAALDCGGDTDTVGAIVGALAGVVVGRPGIPAEWVDGICEWPRSVALMERVASALATQKAQGKTTGPVRCFWPGMLPRNLLFLLVVLVHGFRRLWPK